MPEQVIQYEKTSLTGPLLWDAGRTDLHEALRDLSEKAETLQMRRVPFCFGMEAGMFVDSAYVEFFFFSFLRRI